MEGVTIGGYTMRKHKTAQARLYCDAKYNVKYSNSTDDSSDETYGKPKPVNRRHVAGLSGPSVDRIATQQQLNKHNQKECIATQV